MVKIPNSMFWVNPDFVAYIEPDTDEKTCTKEWATIHMKDGTERRVFCSPEIVCRCLEGENEIARAIESTFSDAFKASSSTPAFLEAIAMALGFRNESSLDHIASALDGISTSIDDYNTKEKGK